MNIFISGYIIIPMLLLGLFNYFKNDKKPEETNHSYHFIIDLENFSEPEVPSLELIPPDVFPLEVIIPQEVIIPDVIPEVIPLILNEIIEKCINEIQVNNELQLDDLSICSSDNYIFEYEIVSYNDATN